MSDSLFHKKTLNAGATGITTFPVSPGRQLQVCVKDKGTGGIFSIIAYLDTAVDTPTREMWTLESAKNGEYAETSIGGFVAIGVNITAPSNGQIAIEVREFKLS